MKTINAGQQGSKKYLQVWGDKLLNVRYREDETGEMIVTTVEIVVGDTKRDIYGPPYIVKQNNPETLIKSKS